MTKKSTSNQKWYQNKTLLLYLALGLIALALILWLILVGPYKFGFMAKLTANYTDPTKTFKVYFPGKKPILIDGTFSNYPIINYYVVDQKTGDEYRVSYLTDVNSLLGVSGPELIKNTGKTVITTLAGTGTDMNLELIILKNETYGDTQVLEAQVLDKNDTRYQLYQVIGRGNELFIIRGMGSSQRNQAYQRFLRSFSLLNQSQQNLNVDLTEEMVDSMPVVIDESQGQNQGQEQSQNQGQEQNQNQGQNQNNLDNSQDLTPSQFDGQVTAQ